MKSFVLSAAAVLFFLNGGSANPVLLTPVEGSRAIQHDDTSINCQNGYSQPANSNWNSCYMVYTDEFSRSDAAASCKSENGSLATVPNAFVNSYIYSLATQRGAKWVWLDIECPEPDKSTCLNDDKTKLVYENFAPREPSADGTCVFMWVLGKSGQTWATVSCKDTYPFVCEAPTGSYVKKRCLDDWTEFQGMCYKSFITEGGEPRDDAAQQCKEAPGGMLATINSKEVNDFVTSLSCTYEYQRIGLQCPNTPKKGDTSTCVWDDGTPFSYSSFAEGEPIRSSKKYFGYSDKGLWHTDDTANSLQSCDVCQAPLQT